METYLSVTPFDEADAEETTTGATGEAAKEQTPAGRVEVEAGQCAPEKEQPGQPKALPHVASKEASGTGEVGFW